MGCVKREELIRYLVVIPIHDEEEVIGATLDELIEVLPSDVAIAVGLNDCRDQSREICHERGVFVGETDSLGYGHGCRAAIREAATVGISADAYLFFAGDGANRPEDLLRCMDLHQSDPAQQFIMGVRRFTLETWLAEFGRALPNLILGSWCRLLGGQFFPDLGPLRLISRSLYEEMDLRELVWGWTIEAQLRAAQLGAVITSFPVRERPRQAGRQKVSGVSMKRSAQVGLEIAKAAWRVRRNRE
ncbi:MAG: glycosyltransferase [Verrucomicrobiota bacterium]